MTKTRFEIGINLKGEAKGKLQPEKPDAMCSHKINLSSLKDIDAEVMDWLKVAYNKAGISRRQEEHINCHNPRSS